MKRSPVPPNIHLSGRAVGTAFLLISLLAGPGLATPTAAVEPSPTSAPTQSSAPTPTTPLTPMVPSPSMDQLSTASPTPDASTVTVPDPASPDDRAAMAAAVGIGGAEMGQRSARVIASSSSPSLKKLTTEASATEGTWKPTFGVQGLDVSSHQGTLDWQYQWNLGARFAYVKATEGNYYTNPSYSSQYQGSRNVGMIRGAYHFAIPNWSSGSDQARYFVQNGGGWTADGYTMPPVLDFEFNPYENRTVNGFYFGNSCYGMSPAQLTSWVRDFGNTVLAMTGRLPMIYTNTSWWNQCLGNPSVFGDYPLWVAAYPSSPTNNAGAVPTGSWSTYSIWQYSSTGPFAGDSNVWNGDLGSLQRFAGNFTVYANGAIGAAWAAAGGGEGLFGYPTSNESCTPSYCVQSFQRRVAYWTAANGIRTIFISGAIGQVWAAAGGTESSWGLATGNEACIANYCYQTFQKRTAYWTASNGVRTVYTPGAVGQAWLGAGGTNSDWGMATTDERCVSNYCYQEFERRTAYWTAERWVLTIYTPGAIGSVWRSQGGTGSSWGMPTTNETCSSVTLCTQKFENRTATWTPTAGVRVS
ncbi:UNVERIFIED_ORG: GH25 family lysozyme M1 (1,4-beta-N-acetylmuramidase) [Arthrobacter sp. UYEF10]